VTFIANEAAPGDPATVFAGEKASLQDIARVRHRMGLDRAWYVRYGESLWNDLHFDFGESYYGTQEPVANILKRDLPMTLGLSLLAILLAAGVGILLGTIGAIYEHKFADKAVLSISTLGVTLPNFVLAPLFVYIFAMKLNRLPQNWEVERVAPLWYYLLMPVVVLAARPMASLTRLTRASMIETLRQEFIRMAIAKGVPTWRLITKHALRNAILPVVTSIGTSFGYLLTGSFVVETFFTMPGIGRETINAIQKHDYPIVQACILVTGMMFVVLNMVVDVILPILDPRIREAQV
jgi:peptide/nickel transport system permease protein